MSVSTALPPEFYSTVSTEIRWCPTCRHAMCYEEADCEEGCGLRVCEACEVEHRGMGCERVIKEANNS